jgi:hypothetical protein
MCKLRIYHWDMDDKLDLVSRFTKKGHIDVPASVRLTERMTVFTKEGWRINRVFTTSFFFLEDFFNGCDRRMWLGPAGPTQELAREEKKKS